MSTSSQRRPSMSSKQGAEALQARRNCGPAANTKKDLHSLGIDIDSDVIERLQALGLHKAWAVASQAATSLKERCGTSKDQLDGKCTAVISPIKYQHHMRKKEEKQAEAKPLEIPVESEWLSIDESRVASIYRDLNDTESSIPVNVRTYVIRLFKMFKSSYGRSPDRFIQLMMGRRSSREPLEAKQLVMKMRYVSEVQFAEIMGRLSNQVSKDHISCMFQIIGEKKVFGGQDVFILDLWMFLALLRHAEEDDRRSFDHKRSRIANDVEFWDSQNRNENSKPANADFRRRVSPQKGRPQSANAAGGDMKRRSVKDKVSSVAEAFGTPRRPDCSVLKKGKFIHGSFSRELGDFGTSVPEALNAPRRPDRADRGRAGPNDSVLFGETVIPLGRHKLNDKFEPMSMTGLMTEGVGVSRAIYGRSLSPPGRRGAEPRSSSMGSMGREDARRATTVAEALGAARGDTRGRAGSPVDARRKVSTLGKPPYIL